MSEKLIGSCIFGQSGGPTAVINASAYGVIKTALEAGEITRVYGASYGIKGVLADRLYVMDEEDPEELRLLLNTPSSELGSCRYKMADPEVDDTDYSAHIYVAPIYEDYCFVNFHELAYAVSNSSNLLTRKLVILGDDISAVVEIAVLASAVGVVAAGAVGKAALFTHLLEDDGIH